MAQELEIITTPTYEWLAENVKTCRTRLVIGSPYVNDAVKEIMGLVKEDLPRTLVTRTDLRDFAVGASNLATLCSLSKNGVDVRTLLNIHAKVYVIDNSMALVTSANATYSGLHRNRECGLATRNPSIVKQLATSLLSGLGAETPPRRMSSKDLEALCDSLDYLRVTMPKQVDSESTGESSSFGEAEFKITDAERLLGGFRGWQRLTLRGVLQMPERYFHIDEIYMKCAPIAAKEYPQNRHVLAKLRQQLQQLRNLGIVEFVDNRGRYKRLLEMEDNDLT